MSVLNKQDVLLPYGVTHEPISYTNGGYEQLTITAATPVSLTVPAFAVAAAITYEDSANTSNVVARFGFNNTPSATNGNPVTNLMYMELYGLTAMTSFSIIAFTALSGKLNVQYYR